MPEAFGNLNKYGVPWLALILSTILPVIVLNVDDSVEGLSHLYAIGVVGAITINVGSCAFARSLPVKRGERITMAVTLTILAAIWITIALTKLQALLFVAVVLALGLGVREYTQRRQRRLAAAPAAPQPPPLRQPCRGRPPRRFSASQIMVAARGWTPRPAVCPGRTRVRGAQLLVLYIREVAVPVDMGANGRMIRKPKLSSLVSKPKPRD